MTTDIKSVPRNVRNGIPIAHSHSITTAALFTVNTSKLVMALVDTGASKNFIAPEMCNEMGLVV
jgi:predicted aspartyl protease